MNNDKLFLAEHGWQVEDIFKRNLGEGRWIAMGPSAMWQLKKLGIEHSIPEDFYDINELETLCTENHSMVENLCSEMDRLIHTDNPKLKELKLRPFLFHLFPLIILFDGIKSRIFMLQKVLGNFPRHEIVIHKNGCFPPGAFDICFSEKENLWSNILLLDGWNRETLFIPLETFENEDVLRLNITSSLKRIAKTNIILNTFMRLISKLDLKGILATLNFLNKGSLLINSDQYEFSSIMGKLNTVGYGVFYLGDDIRGQDYSEAKTVLKEELRKKALTEDYFCFSGIDFFPLLKDRLEYLLEKVPGRYTNLAGRVEKSIKRLRIKALLNYGSPRPDMHAINQVVKNPGIPVISWQHGMVSDFHGKPSQFFGVTDQITSDISMVYGNRVKELYEKCPSHSRVVAVGSSRIDGLKQNIWLSKKNELLYVTTSYYGNYWYCGVSGFNDRLFYSDQVKIMDILSDLSKTHSINVKLHPGNQPPWVDNYCDSNVFFARSSPSYTDLLKTARVVIIDLPSTVLLEAINSDIPVFVLLKHWRYTSEEYELLSKRAVCYYSVESLLEGLLLYLKTGYYPANINNRDFLKLYGTFIDDGRSGERALDIITTAIGQVV